MKVTAVVIGMLLTIWLAAWPPKLGLGQDSTQAVKIKLEDPVDTAGFSPMTTALIDSFNSGYLRIANKTDSIIELARQLESKTAAPRKYVVTDYEAPVAVLRIPFENKTILARYDSKRRVFIEEEIIIK